MSEKKEKRILVQIGNVRIREENELNVVIEREETYFIPKDKQKVTGWKFRGYAGSILEALRLIHAKGLLINQNAVSDLKSHLEQIEKANGLILEALEGKGIGVSS